MRARGIVGRRITKIHQTRAWDQTINEFTWSLTSIELDDHTRIVFHGNDDGDSLFVTATVVPS